MSLSPGTRVGAYEVLAPLGAGGMGEVYRARDTRLGREVALKVLPDAFMHDAERVARFAREAQLLAALNHPNIAQIYAFEDGALSLELVDGPTLADRLAIGPIPLDESIAIALQIADALDAAHAQGIIHRDLKPANVKVRPDGTVKVLDFGLAKLSDPATSASAVLQSLSPTITSPVMATGVGVILGTAAYMAPEQARGKAADRRADVWAFGCVLFEMLTARRAFDDEDVSLTLSRVLQRDPEFTLLPAETPGNIRQLLALCLRKDPRRRLADMQVVRLFLANDLEAPLRSDSTQSLPKRIGPGVIAATVAAAAIVAAGAAWWLKPLPVVPAGPVVQFSVAPPGGGQFPGANGAPRMAISPDGGALAVAVSQAGKPDQLWIRRLDALEPVQATNLATATLTGPEPVQQPFWSPDGRYVGFFVSETLRALDVTTGVVQIICPVPGNQYGGTWAADGTILFGSALTKGLMRLTAAGGIPRQVTTLSDGETAHLWPRFLPDGRHFLYLSQGGPGRPSAVYAGSLDGGAPKQLLASRTMAEFAPPDLVLYLRDQTLLAQHLDLNAMTFRGDPVVAASSVQATNSGRIAASVSTNGVLAYAVSTESNGADGQLAWIDRTGQPGATVGSPATNRGMDLSRDGRLLLVHRDDSAGGDIWSFDLERGTGTRLTFDPAQHNSAPVLLPDGRRMVFLKGEAKAIYEKDVSGIGAERLVYKSPGPTIVPWTATPDGAAVIVSLGDTTTQFHLARLSLTGGDPEPLGPRAAAQGQAQLSPDGKWLAYTSTASGASGLSEVFIESFPAGDTRYQVSTAGGRAPRWRGDGRELFFMAAQAQTIPFMAVSVEPVGRALRLGIPRKLFEVMLPNPSHSFPILPYAVSGDGSRFLVSRRPQTQSTGMATNAITVVMNWQQAPKN